MARVCERKGLATLRERMENKSRVLTDLPVFILGKTLSYLQFVEFFKLSTISRTMYKAWQLRQSKPVLWDCRYVAPEKMPGMIKALQAHPPITSICLPYSYSSHYIQPLIDELLSCPNLVNITRLCLTPNHPLFWDELLNRPAEQLIQKRFVKLNIGAFWRGERDGGVITRCFGGLIRATQLFSATLEALHVTFSVWETILSMPISEPLLPNLRKLQFSAFETSEQTTRFQPPDPNPLHRFSNLNTLIVDSVHLHHNAWAHVHHLLTTATKISKLRVCIPEMVPCPDTLMSLVARLPLTSLSLFGFAANSKMISLPFQQTLKKLHLQHLNWTDDDLNAIHAMPQLEHLTLWRVVAITGTFLSGFKCKNSVKILSCFNLRKDFVEKWVAETSCPCICVKGGNININIQSDDSH